MVRERPPAGETGGRLRIEITVALCVKVLLLFLLWAACFSHPPAKRTIAGAVADSVYGPVAMPPTDNSRMP